MTNSLVPLRKTFAKYAQKPVANFIITVNLVVVLPVTIGVGWFYGTRSLTVDTWDYQVSENHEQGVNGFRDNLEEMVVLKAQMVDLQAQMSNGLEASKQIYMDGDVNAVNRFEQKMKESSDVFRIKATSYVQNLVLSRDIHEQDYYDLGQDFKNYGFSKYSDINLHASYQESASRMECYLKRVKSPKWDIKSDFDKAGSLGRCMGDIEPHYEDSFVFITYKRLLISMTTYFLPILLSCGWGGMWGVFKLNTLELGTLKIQKENNKIKTKPKSVADKSFQKTKVLIDRKLKNTPVRKLKRRPRI